MGITRLKNKIINSFFLLFLIFFTSCATIDPAVDSGYSGKIPDQLLQATPNVITEQISRYDGLKQKISAFRQRLNAGGALSDEDWRLHDELLQAYASLKSITIDNKIQIPAHSRISIPIQTFCLNPGVPAPVPGEKFIWKTDDTEIPYFRDVVAYAIKHPEIDQPTIQTLIWNLKKETRWENYPINMQSILLAIDPQSSLKLPSNVKDQIQTKVTNAVTDKLKEWGLWQDSQRLTDWVKGEYRNFDSIQQELLSLKSKFPLTPDNSLGSIPGTPLYADTQTNSYSSHVIIFYNSTDSPVTVDLGKYYMQSKRPDVQRMALKKIIPAELAGVDDPEQAPIVQDLKNVLYKDMLRLGLGFVPVVGDVADLYELFKGKDFVSGEGLTWQGRLLSGLGLIAGSGSGYRYALRVINSPGEFINEFEKGLSKVLNKPVVLEKEKLKDVENIFKDGTFQGLKQEIKQGDKIKVIGRRPDTAVAKEWSGHDVLDLPNKEWTPERNDQWVDEGIANKHPFYKASPETKENIWRNDGTKTVYGQELERIRRAGYKDNGDYLLAP
ncbi:MAG: pre-toxin TG domain-containing protein [Candidatus Omnitrophica bacterium]|nr:pre-toxin TG domain-containing protein [Candidatus Omnitrophota bacterium]